MARLPARIALRHHTAGKNKTDGVDSVPVIHARYLIAFIYPITATIRQFWPLKGTVPRISKDAPGVVQSRGAVRHAVVCALYQGGDLLELPPAT